MRRGAFTLIEMLVTITIIAILAAVVLGVVHGAREAARKERTKTTIAKLHRIVMERWESYRTRRVPLSKTDIDAIIQYHIGNSGWHPDKYVQNVARARLVALRDIMRMEMPERWNDVLDDPILRRIRPLADRPSLSKFYGLRYRLKRPSTTYGSAECLYMLVTMRETDARRQFHDDEIGDCDGDGCPEFVDGWGNPIYFLRWAPAFNGSDMQLNAVPPEELETMAWDDVEPTKRKRDAAQNDHDPFDQRKTDMEDASNAADYPRGWRLVPLIYSAGPDGIYDLNFSPGTTDYHYTGEVYDSMLGQPLDIANTSVTATGPANGSLNHYDNIHNHRIEGN